MEHGGMGRGSRVSPPLEGADVFGGEAGDLGDAVRAGLGALGVEHDFEDAAADGAGEGVPVRARRGQRVERGGEVGRDLERLDPVERGPCAVGLRASPRRGQGLREGPSRRGGRCGPCWASTSSSRACGGRSRAWSGGRPSRASGCRPSRSRGIPRRLPRRGGSGRDRRAYMTRARRPRCACGGARASRAMSAREATSTSGASVSGRRAMRAGKHAAWRVAKEER